MFLRIILFSFILLFCGGNLFAQIKGLVQGSDSTKTKPIFGAKVKLLRAKTATFTNDEGTFELVLSKQLPDTLIASAPGYRSDTIILDKNDRFSALHIVLYSDKLLPEVVISLRKSSHGISKMKTLHVEELTAGEFKKAACCNLSESFETNASVDVNITDAVSGARKIQLLGLDGVYTQIQLENIPFLRGLESSLGIQTIPGTWIESIQITKGTGTVVNGYESMAGLVNLEFKKPQSMEKLFVNVYQSIYGRSELNLDQSLQMGKKWSTSYMAHASSMFGNIDRNKDGFRDMPMGSSFALLNRWNYHGRKMEAQMGVNANWNDKVGGQTSYWSNQNNPNVYGVKVVSRHLDVFAKTGFFLKKPEQSIGVVYNLKYQDLTGQFGNRHFLGTEKRAYVNAIYDDYIQTTDHRIKAGISFLALSIQQKMENLQSNRMELVPGVFGEYTFTGSRITAVAGMRYDYHNLYKGQFSPRVHLKIALDEFTDLRITAGKGWRVPNYIVDNLSLLASSKTWLAPNELQPEISWNTGASVVREFKLFKRKSTLTIDYYYTHFVHQLLVDRDTNSSFVVFKNVHGGSQSHSLQAEWSVSPIKNLELRLAYKWLSVKASYGGVIQQQVMIPSYRGLVNVAYQTRNKRWNYDVTCTIYGASRMPDMYMSGTSHTTWSPVYALLNAQVTHTYKNWEIYLGGENLTDYRQKNPIIDASNPFGSAFDATNVWGPVLGINVYAGFRFTIKNKEKK